MKQPVWMSQKALFGRTWGTVIDCWPTQMACMQGYHADRNTNKDDWKKIDFPIKNVTTVGEIVSVCTTHA